MPLVLLLGSEVLSPLPELAVTSTCVQELLYLQSVTHGAAPFLLCIPSDSFWDSNMTQQAKHKAILQCSYVNTPPEPGDSSIRTTAYPTCTLLFRQQEMPEHNHEGAVAVGRSLSWSLK